MSDIESDRRSVHSDSSFDEADDQDWADWVDDEQDDGKMQYAGTSASGPSSFKVPTQALFPDAQGSFKIFDSPLEALKDASAQHGCDFVAVTRRCRKCERL